MISSGSPQRRRGIEACRCLAQRVSAYMSLVMSVRNTPGAMPMTRIPYGPHSMARTRVKCITPALAVPYAALSGCTRMAEVELMLMILPYRCLIMTGATVWLTKNSPARSVAVTWSHVRRLRRNAASPPQTPALLMRMSIRGNTCRACLTARCTTAWSVTSTRWTSTRENLRREAAWRSRALRSRAQRMTSAPACARACAIAAPRPREAPVTSATRPVSPNSGPPRLALLARPGAGSVPVLAACAGLRARLAAMAGCGGLDGPRRRPVAGGFVAQRLQDGLHEGWQIVGGAGGGQIGGAPHPAGPGTRRGGGGG